MILTVILRLSYDYVFTIDNVVYVYVKELTSEI